MNNVKPLRQYTMLRIIIWLLSVCILTFTTLLYFNPSFLKKQNQALKVENLNLPPLEVGDIIFRRGDSFESVIISQISQHHYTHLGIITSTHPLTIIHATTDDNKNRQNQVIASSLSEFIAHAQALAIKRLALTKAQKDAIRLAANSQLGKAFVLNDTDEAFYCTTFVESLLKPHIKLNLTYDKVNLPTLSGNYLFPKEFFNAPQAKLIYEKRLF